MGREVIYYYKDLSSKLSLALPAVHAFVYKNELSLLMLR